MNAEKRARLDRGMSPKVVAVVGAKKIADYSWLKAVRDFSGKAYSVQIDQNEIPGILELGFTNVASVKDIPEEVDYVICAVPRNVARFIINDSIAKQVGAICLFTSGYAETGSPEGAQMQAVITKMAADADLNMVGPNCMGIYNPSVGLRVTAEQLVGPEYVGPVGFISQSGSQAIGFASVAAENGIGMTKVVSFGNGVVLHGADYLEYFAEDPDTKIIGCYLEGVTEGRRFFEVLRQVAAMKPVVIWKGGITADSARATRSHTASLAVDSAIWESMVRQAGAVNVHGLEEMIDVIKALQFTTPTTGKRMGLIAVAGGHSVEIADAFSREGGRVPALTQESYDQLRPWYNDVGGSFQNPIEGGGNLGDEGNIVRLLDILDNDDNIDCIGLELGGGGAGFRGVESLMKRADTLAEWRRRGKKPLWAIHGAVNARVDPANLKAVNAKLQAGGVPGFHSFNRAAKAMAKFRAYSERVLGEG
ncbi:MAG: CoA-binding protein [Chloroflexi bacterium]|nr:CoA-binding protein [Chloroflexota bacterium]